MEDHKEIHASQVKLEALLLMLYNASKLNNDVTADGAEFYLSLSEFHGKYLEHTAEEERVTQPLLWKYFTDEELASHRGKIMAKNPPETLMIWFRFVIPALSYMERIGLLTGFQKMASPEFFDKGMNVIKQVLTEVEYAELQTALCYTWS
jgi:hypothetical protein